MLEEVRFLSYMQIVEFLIRSRGLGERLHVSHGDCAIAAVQKQGCPTLSMMKSSPAILPLMGVDSTSSRTYQKRQIQTPTSSRRRP